MKHPLQIAFHGMDASEALEAKIREKVESLENYYDKIDHCRVVFDSPHNHGAKGNLFSVRIELGVPGSDIVVTKEHRADHAHEDPYVAVRDAFEAAKRQLVDYVDKQRGHVKRH